MNEKIYIANSIKETQQIADELASKVTLGECLAFYGNLGSGKTTFIQTFAKSLGVKKRIISPTFIIVRTYDLGGKMLYHIDLYRTQTQNDLFSVGIDEIIKDKNAITAIEWAEKLGDLLPKKRIDLHFKYIDEDKREIRIKKHI